MSNQLGSFFNLIRFGAIEAEQLDKILQSKGIDGVFTRDELDIWRSKSNGQEQHSQFIQAKMFLSNCNISILFNAYSIVAFIFGPCSGNIFQLSNVFFFCIYNFSVFRLILIHSFDIYFIHLLIFFVFFSSCREAQNWIGQRRRIFFLIHRNDRNNNKLNVCVSLSLQYA